MQPGPRAVVVDTNFVKRGAFDQDALKRLADRLGQRGHVLVVPDVVTWEWAQHAHDAATSLERALEGAERRLDRAFGLPIPPVSVPPVGDFLTALSKTLARIQYAELASASAEAARAAIANQVLQTGPASRSRDGTKTGAADALVLSVVSELRGRFDEVVLATRDKRLAAAARSMDGAVTVVASQRELWQWHGVVPPTDECMKEALWLYVCDEVYGTAGPDKEFSLFRSGWFIEDEDEPRGQFLSPGGQPAGVVVTAVDYPDMSDVEVVETETPPYLVIADVSVHCTVAITERLHPPDSPEPVERIFSSKAVIYADVTVDFDEDWSPRSLDVDAPAQISLRSPE